MSITVLFETQTTKEIRILFKKGQLMKKHQTKFPITIEIVKGAIDFGVENKTYNLTKGDLVSLKGGVPHDLFAVKKSIVRLTLSKLDTVDRVKNIVN
ncbi:MAG: cupin [Flavobacteriaceae bacterium]|nr:cupin [Flavobacteriaceae bacterium]